ncbi:hypothetical protein F5883DRAFT_695186, partial [Diaporthe sp. PMI_573]
LAPSVLQPTPQLATNTLILHLAVGILQELCLHHQYQERFTEIQTPSSPYRFASVLPTTIPIALAVPLRQPRWSTPTAEVTSTDPSQANRPQQHHHLSKDLLQPRTTKPQTATVNTAMLTKKAHTESASADSPALPESVISALQLFESLRHPRYGPDANHTGQEDVEIQEIDISPEEYRLLRRLLGQKEDLDQERAFVPDQEELSSNKKAYLRLLREAGLRCCCSVEELQALGRWVLDFVRYDFVSVYDDTAPPSRRNAPLHVNAFTGFKCQFTNKFYHMMEDERAKRRLTRPVHVPGQGTPPRAAQPQQATAEERPQSRTRSQTRNQPVVPHTDAEPSRNSRAEDTGAPQDDGAASTTDRIGRDEERLRYEEANPDVCIYIGDRNTTVIPAIIIEVGFSHPLPFDRARSYIYGSDGQCRLVVCLDINYRDLDARLESYRHMRSQPGSSEAKNPRPPPYELTMHLFRCRIENKVGPATITVKHELKYVDVRELARLGQTLKLKAADLIGPDDGGEDEAAVDEDPMERERASDEELQDTFEIPYAEMDALRAPGHSET